MSIAELLLPEWDNEVRVTREVLALVPDDGDERLWKPHDDALALAHLAQLVARVPGWVPLVTQQTELDVDPGGRQSPGYSIERTAVLLAEFDANARIGRSAIAVMTNRDFRVAWRFKSGGRTTFTQPRYQALRGWVLNHLVHHRAELALYLRLLGEPVPPIYDLAADTSWKDAKTARVIAHASS